MLFSGTTRHAGVAVADYLHVARNRNCYVRCCKVSRIIVKREPTRRVHQIALVLADSGKTFVNKRAASRTVQDATVFEAKRDRRSLCHRFAEVDTDAWAKIADACLVLNEHDSALRRFGFYRTAFCRSNR